MRLGVFARPILFFFFIIAKVQRPACGRQAQRNYGPLSLTFRRGGQASLLCGLASLRAIFFLLAKAQRRKEIVFNLSALSTCLPAGGLGVLAALRALFFYSRKAHRVWHGLDQLMLKIISQKKELHFCNSFDSIEPLAGIEPATY